MIRWRRKPRPYAVDGVTPRRDSDGWDIYEGDELAGQPVVAAALGRLPRHPDLEYLAYSLSVSTKDGREWVLGFGDEALIWFDLSAPDGTDIFEDALRAAGFTAEVERVDREAFVLATAEPLTADVLLAHCLDVCDEVFRALSEK